jgi:hypothetical protein
LTNRHLSPNNLPCAGQAGICASAAEFAFIQVCYRPVVDNRNCLFGAGLDTLKASDTSTLAKAVFGVCPPAFRIVAPLTFQGAAFEEHSRADTRAVMYGVFLYVEYESLYY